MEVWGGGEDAVPWERGNTYAVQSLDNASANFQISSLNLSSQAKEHVLWTMRHKTYAGATDPSLPLLLPRRKKEEEQENRAQILDHWPLTLSQPERRQDIKSLLNVWFTSMTYLITEEGWYKRRKTKTEKEKRKKKKKREWMNREVVDLKGRAPGNIGSMKAIGISSDLRY